MLTSTIYSTKHRLAAVQSHVEFHATKSVEHSEEIVYVEVAEEDDIPDENLSEPAPQQNYSDYEWGYTSMIHTRYLQQYYALQRQAEEPFFVLYHSWRSHIS